MCLFLPRCEKPYVYLLSFLIHASEYYCYSFSLYFIKQSEIAFHQQVRKGIKVHNTNFPTQICHIPLISKTRLLNLVARLSERQTVYIRSRRQEWGPQAQDNYQLSSTKLIFIIKIDIYKILNQILILVNSIFQYGQYNGEIILI